MGAILRSIPLIQAAESPSDLPLEGDNKLARSNYKYNKRKKELARKKKKEQKREKKIGKKIDLLEKDESSNSKKKKKP